MILEFVVKCGIVILNGIFNLFKLLPQKKKITYISRQMNTTPDDFRRLKVYFEKEDPTYHQVLLTKMIPASKVGKLFYCFHMFRQMYHIATSEVIILDTYCIAISILKQRDNLLVIQIWHALGSFKKFGYSILGNGEGSSLKTAKLMKMHQNYSYVTTSSDHCLPYFQEAFNQEKDHMIVYPLPRLDLFYSVDEYNHIKQSIYKVYPLLKNPDKKVIVYAPTFRKGDQQPLIKGIQDFIDTLSEDYIVVLKKHPLTEYTFNDERVIEDKQFDSMMMFLVADIIVTDYSASMYEAAILNKPIYFYTFDYDDYLVNRDFYEPFERLVPGPICKGVNTLKTCIDSNTCDVKKVEAFSKKMIKPFNQSYTEDLGRFILEHIKS